MLEPIIGWKNPAKAFTPQTAFQDGPTGVGRGLSFLDFDPSSGCQSKPLFDRFHLVCALTTSVHELACPAAVIRSVKFRVQDKIGQLGRGLVGRPARSELRFQVLSEFAGGAPVLREESHQTEAPLRVKRSGEVDRQQVQEEFFLEEASFEEPLRSKTVEPGDRGHEECVLSFFQSRCFIRRESGAQFLQGLLESLGSTKNSAGISTSLPSTIRVR